MSRNSDTISIPWSLMNSVAKVHETTEATI
jgi:hypothetical protein